MTCGEKGTFSKTLSGGAGRRGTISRRGGLSFEVKILDEGKTSRDKVEGKGMNAGEWSGQSGKENMRADGTDCAFVVKAKPGGVNTGLRVVILVYISGRGVGGDGFRIATTGTTRELRGTAKGPSMRLGDESPSG